LSLFCIYDNRRSASLYINLLIGRTLVAQSKHKTHSNNKQTKNSIAHGGICNDEYRRGAFTFRHKAY